MRVSGHLPEHSSSMNINTHTFNKMVS